jgi:hypothetical protein
MRSNEGYLFVPLAPPWRAPFLVAGALMIATQLLPVLIGGLLLIFGGSWLWAQQRTRR